MKPRMLWACQSVAAMRSCKLAPSDRFNNSITRFVLLPVRAVLRLRVGPRFVVLVFLGATPDGCGRLAARLCMAFQIRTTAALRLVNLLTGFWPGKQFQTATSREPGQSSASRFSSAGSSLRGFSFRGDDRAHHMDHSAGLHKQANFCRDSVSCAVNRSNPAISTDVGARPAAGTRVRGCVKRRWRATPRI